MEFAGDDLRNIILAVLARRPEGLPKPQAYDLFKREYIERGNEWSELLDKPCGAGQLDKPQSLQNIAGVTASMTKKGMLDKSVPGILRLARELPDEVLPVVAVATEPPVAPDPGLIADNGLAVGTGPEAVYAWTHSTDKELAHLKAELRYPVKIGYSANRDPRPRIRASLMQGQTALHSGIELLLVYYTDESRKWERAIHAILDVRGQKIEGGLGQEWYRTSPDEIVAVINLINEQPGLAQRVRFDGPTEGACEQ